MTKDGTDVRLFDKKIIELGLVSTAPACVAHPRPGFCCCYRRLSRLRMAKGSIKRPAVFGTFGSLSLDLKIASFNVSHVQSDPQKTPTDTNKIILTTKKKQFLRIF